MAKGPRRDRAKEQFWQERLTDIHTSGQSIRGFCRALGLPESGVYL
jgi:hypothetical protein